MNIGGIVYILLELVGVARDGAVMEDSLDG